MADDTGKRIGCGCLPLVVAVLVGAWVVRALFAVGGGDVDAGAGLVTGVGVALFALFVVVARRRSRQAERERLDDGVPTSTTSPEPASPPGPAPVSRRTSKPAAPAPLGEPSFPVEAETGDLRRRLADAVADIAADVEEAESASPTRSLTSAEMIARAKKRIAERRPD